MNMALQTVKILLIIVVYHEIPGRISIIFSLSETDNTFFFIKAAILPGA